MKYLETKVINEHVVINGQDGKKFFRINDHVGKSATTLELNFKLNKLTWSFIRYLRVLATLVFALHDKNSKVQDTSKLSA